MNTVAADKKFLKATKLESRQHVTQVVEWQLQGKTPFEIVQLASQAWGICERQARTYISKATDAIYEEMDRTDRHKYFAMKLHQLDGCVALALRQNQPAAACAAIGMQLKMVGISSLAS